MQTEKELALLGTVSSLAGCEGVSSLEHGVEKLKTEIQQLRAAGLSASEATAQLAKLQAENAKLLAAIEAERRIQL